MLKSVKDRIAALLVVVVCYTNPKLAQASPPDLTPFDLKCLKSYANNILDFHVILDLLPNIVSLYFEQQLGHEVM